jgi:putative CocE/NonD family hydrolase
MGITQNLLAPGAPDSLRAQHVMVAFSDMYSQAAYQGGVWRESLFERWLKANKFDPESLETLLAHPRYDDFWAGLNAEAQAERVNAPAIFWGGWYDIFLQGTIHSFTTIQARGGPRARGHCRLIIGPWAHGTFDELTYPDDKPPVAADAFRFFAHHLNGADNGVDRDPPVHYYVMGDPDNADAPGNCWRSALHWPPPSTATPYYSVSPLP